MNARLFQFPAYYYFRWMICGVGFSVLTVLGLLGNITSLIILTNRFDKSI